MKNLVITLVLSINLINCLPNLCEGNDNWLEGTGFCLVDNGYNIPHDEILEIIEITQKWMNRHNPDLFTIKKMQRIHTRDSSRINFVDKPDLIHYKDDLNVIGYCYNKTDGYSNIWDIYVAIEWAEKKYLYNWKKILAHELMHIYIIDLKNTNGHPLAFFTWNQDLNNPKYNDNSVEALIEHEIDCKWDYYETIDEYCTNRYDNEDNYNRCVEFKMTQLNCEEFL